MEGAKYLSTKENTSGLAPVVQTLDSAIFWINHYPLDNSIGFASVYPLASDLSGGQRYPSFEQLGPGGQKAIYGYAENGNKSVTICYCKGVAKEKKDEEAILQQQLSSLHQLMCENQLQDTITKYYEVKLK